MVVSLRLHECRSARPVSLSNRFVMYYIEESIFLAKENRGKTSNLNRHLHKLAFFEKEKARGS
jgi:hypothetical protein